MIFSSNTQNTLTSKEKDNLSAKKGGQVSILLCCGRLGTRVRKGAEAAEGLKHPLKPTERKFHSRSSAPRGRAPPFPPRAECPTPDFSLARIREHRVHSPSTASSGHQPLGRRMTRDSVSEIQTARQHSAPRRRTSKLFGDCARPRVIRGLGWAEPGWGRGRARWAWAGKSSAAAGSPAPGPRPPLSWSQWRSQDPMAS